LIENLMGCFSSGAASASMSDGGCSAGFAMAKVGGGGRGSDAVARK
jgi:hypothetical protein